MQTVSCKYLFFNLFMFIALSSCDSKGHLAVSSDITESKKRNVFVAEYEVKPNPFVINDTLRLKITKAWLEHKWAYGNSFDETIIIKDLYQLVIESEQRFLKDYGVTWRIGVDGDRYIRSCGTTCLMSDFSGLPKEVEEWDVQSGWNLDSLSKKIIIGRFRISKKS
jgi:hypothetical protein